MVKTCRNCKWLESYYCGWTTWAVPLDEPITGKCLSENNGYGRGWEPIEGKVEKVLDKSSI